MHAWLGRVAWLCAVVSFAATGCGDGLGEGPLGGAAGDESTAGPEVEVQGEFRMVVYDDFDSGRSWTELRVELDDGEVAYRLEGLDPDSLPESLAPGATIRVTGRLVDPESIRVDTRPGPDCPLVRGVEVLSPPMRAVSASGVRNTLMIVANFTDMAVRCTNAMIDATMFGATDSVDGLYREMTFGKVGFNGTVVGPFTINVKSTSACDGMGWASKAENAAKQAGIRTTSYDHIVTVLPPAPGCGYSGIANLVGSRAVVLACSISPTYAHELGHNLGMHHANTDTIEYGDRSDVMGYTEKALLQVNAPHKVQMGWIASSQVMQVSSSGVFELAPLELDPASAGGLPQILYFRNADSNENYFLSYRQRLGYDAPMALPYVGGASLHRHSGSGPTVVLSRFEDGMVWEDPVSQVAITQLSHDASGVTVQVEFIPDTQPPSDPQGLRITTSKQGNKYKANLVWTASSDDVGVTGYDVARNGTVIASSASVSFTDANVSKGTAYTYAVRAKDAAGNLSGWSSPVTVVP